MEPCSNKEGQIAVAPEGKLLLTNTPEAHGALGVNLGAALEAHECGVVVKIEYVQPGAGEPRPA